MRRCCASIRPASRAFSSRVRPPSEPAGGSDGRGWKIHDPHYETRVRSSFARQSAMKLIGAELRRVAPGEVEIEMPYSAALCQQNNYIHGGIITTIVDSACGYAAYSLTSAESNILSVEFKINFVSPAEGRLFRACGSVLKPGKTITTTRGEVWSVNEDGGKDKLVAAMQATMIAVPAVKADKC